MIHAQHIQQDVIAVRHQQPLVHAITNYVAMSFNANALLAIGASPIMAHAANEVETIAQLSGALLINIGTLDPEWLHSMQLAMRAAKAKSIPMVIDPVGAGATDFRTQAVLSLCAAAAPSVIRGNASEILALAGNASSCTKGVDSVADAHNACMAGQQLSEQYDCTVVISGARDFVIHGAHIDAIDNGVPLMTKVTGMGCTASALIAAFCAVQKDYARAAISAMAVMGIAGELAFANSKGPGSFQVQFLDTLYQLQEADIAARVKLKRVQ